MAKSLSTQAKQHVGKNWSVGSLTREKNLGNIGRLCDRIEDKFGLQDIQTLKPGHIETVIRELQAEGLKSSALSGYMTAARMIAAGVGKPNIVPRTNAAWGISRAGERQKPIEPDRIGLNQVRDDLAARGVHLVLANDLRAVFGLRQKESLLSSKTTERDGKIYLVVEGAKGGKLRHVEVETELQRALLVAVQEHIKSTGGRSLCPPEKTLKQALDHQRNALSAVGARRIDRTNAHAHRHGWAQDQKSAGKSAGKISKDMGHERPEILGNYIPK